MQRWGKHIFPGNILAYGEEKKIVQDLSVAYCVGTASMLLHGFYPLEVIPDGFNQHPDVFISHLEPAKVIAG